MPQKYTTSIDKYQINNWMVSGYLILMVLFASCESQIPTIQPSKPVPANITQIPSKSPARSTPTASQVPNPTVTPNNLIYIDPADPRGVTINLWHAFSGDSGNTFQELVNEFNSVNEYNIHIEAIYQGNYNDLYNKVSSLSSSTEYPGITVANLYQILAWKHQSKNIVDLKPYLNDPGWGLSTNEQSDYYPIFWGYEEINGARLSIPAQRTAVMMAYNLSWANELGYKTPPITTEEFKAQACAAARKNNNDRLTDNNGTGGWVTNTTPATMLSWMYAFGSQIINPAGTGYMFNSDPVKGAFTYLKSLYDAGCAWSLSTDNSAGGEGESEHAELEFATRKALFISLSLVDLGYLEKALENVGNKDQWTVIPFPSDTKPTITVSGPSYVMFNSSPEKQLAGWIFLKWLLSPQNQARWINTTGTFPLQTSALDLLDDYASKHPQWRTAIQLLPFGKQEPNLASWGVVRWVVSDVGSQLFRYYFTADRIPATIKLLDETAVDILKQNP